MSVIAVLREATGLAHASLDAAMRIDDGLTLDRYTRLLTAFYGYVAPWEQALGRAMASDVVGAAQGMLPSSHTERIVADLHALGIDPDALPLAAPPVRVHSLADAVGTAYVMEGSMLGGRVITRIVTRTLGLDAGRGCAYFAGYGDDAGRRWNAFRAFADGAVTEREYERAASAATTTFATLHAWLVEQRAVARDVAQDAA